MKYTYKHTLHACYTGYITQAIINNLAPLLFIIFQDEFHISYEMIGRLILINFATQLFVDVLAVKFVDRLGYRLSLSIAHICCVVGLVCLGLLPRIMPSPYLGLLIAVVIYAVGGGLIEVQISPLVDSLPGEAKASAMSLLHSFYCWGQVLVVLVTTLVLKLVGSSIWFILPIFWALIPLFNFIRFQQIPMPEPVPEGERIPVRQLFRSNVFRMALLMMFCAGAAELTMSQWSSLFAEKGLGVPKVLGDLLGPCLFAVFMGVGRIIYGLWGQKLRIKRILMLSAVFCVVCYLTAVLFQNPVLSLIGCSLCGLGVSLMWPGTFSLSSQYYPKGGTSMFALLAVFGDLGCAMGPWLAGLISDATQRTQVLWASLSAEQAGLRSGILFGTLFPLLMLAGLILMRKKESE